MPTVKPFKVHGFLLALALPVMLAVSFPSHCLATVEIEPDSHAGFPPRVIDLPPLATPAHSAASHHFWRRANHVALPLPQSPNAVLVKMPAEDTRLAYAGAATLAPFVGPAKPAYGAPPQLITMIARANPSLSLDEVRTFAQAVSFYAGSFNVDARLLTSLVTVESSFRTAAVSSSGAIGLGQLKPDTARWLGVDDPYNPMQNLMGCAKYLRFLLDHYQGNVPNALAAYAQGQGTIDKIGINADANYYISKVSRVLAQVN